MFNKNEEYHTDDLSSIFSMIVTVSEFESSIGSKVKLSLYRDKLNSRAIDGSVTTNKSPS
jgi:hypothetical protein